jgi:OmcA/MtrC family decaheme c-type cytochrome
MVYAYHQFDFNGVTYRETSAPALAQIRVGSSGTADAHVAVVTDTKCNACHGDLRLHGNTRKGVEGCVMCHASGAEDRPNVLAGQTQDPAPDTIDFRVMIHKIHYAEELSVVQNGGKYDIVGFASGQPADTGSVIDFSDGTLPTMPEGAKQCVTCHASDAWKVPVERPDMNIWKVACTSCHDSSATAAHVQLNTLGIGQEACAACHGPEDTFSVENVHKVRITGLKQ